MEVKKIFTQDLIIAQALINRDEAITRQFFYKQCYPLFKSIHDHYFTDCQSCKEFIDEMYIIVLAPSKTTGRCQLQNFRGESTLASWLKSACLYYCYKRYEARGKVVHQYESSGRNDNYEESDRNENAYGSIDIDITNINRQDALMIISQMPNKRYSELIRLRYLESKTNEEVAEALGMTMANYYNKHKSAKAQYLCTLKKEAGNE